MNKKEKESCIRRCVKNHNTKMKGFLLDINDKLDCLIFDEKELYQEIKEKEVSDENKLSIYWESYTIKEMAMFLERSLPVKIIMSVKTNKTTEEVKISNKIRSIKNQIDNIHNKITHLYQIKKD